MSKASIQPLKRQAMVRQLATAETGSMFRTTKVSVRGWCYRENETSANERQNYVLLE